jgi:hypothetical protein
MKINYYFLFYSILSKGNMHAQLSYPLPQGAELTPPFPQRVAKTGQNHLNEEITPPPPHWDRREI